MTREEEEFNEGIKDAGVDKLNKLPPRNLDSYNSESYKEGYQSVYEIEKTKADIDKKIEETAKGTKK